MAKMGRPTKDKPYRYKTLRFSRIEDQLLDIIDTLKDEKEKKLVSEILEKLKPVS